LHIREFLLKYLSIYLCIYLSIIQSIKSIKSIYFSIYPWAISHSTFFFSLQYIKNKNKKRDQKVCGAIAKKKKKDEMLVRQHGRIR
jgi:hypothetical protein